VVEIHSYTSHQRPASQGGLWFTADDLKIHKELT
jgi:hypothetical protein